MLRVRRIKVSKWVHVKTTSVPGTCPGSCMVSSSKLTGPFLERNKVIILWTRKPIRVSESNNNFPSLQMYLPQYYDFNTLTVSTISFSIPFFWLVHFNNFLRTFIQIYGLWKRLSIPRVCQTLIWHDIPRYPYHNPLKRYLLFCHTMSYIYMIIAFIKNIYILALKTISIFEKYLFKQTDDPQTSYNK